ncbi:nucleotidyltransferase domain-containing protein [Deinococcus apachensis]|uniref:nucleotidyltransferase domain-containing protein n=1 Tax=Deinococcus apachensis TaxID=309886 RepID=UPI000476BDB4|nr:nucleotidyltransferase domain-containing protein [Deinococcus apachensis]
MNPASEWRRDIAVGVAQIYARNPNVVAVILGGSSARGHADRFSDIELGVFWEAEPSEVERAAIVQGVWGDQHQLYPHEGDTWEDTFFMGRAALEAEKSGVLTEVVNMRARAAERTLDDVLLTFDTDEGKHNLVAALLDGVPLHGKDLLMGWQARAVAYPDDLVRAMVRRYAPIDHFWRWEMYLARGENLWGLHQHFGWVQRRLLHVLMAVNRVYFFSFKWLDVVLERLLIAPKNFAERFKWVDRLPPKEAANELSRLVDEVYDLLERHVPGMTPADVARLRHFFHYRRPLWEERPPF